MKEKAAIHGKNVLTQGGDVFFPELESMASLP
jgi:hypothetical protein